MYTQKYVQIAYSDGHLHREIPAVPRRQMRLPTPDCMSDMWPLPLGRRRSQGKAGRWALNKHTKRKI